MQHEPWEALTTWIGRFTEFVGTKRGLAAALPSGEPALDDLPHYLMEHLELALDGLLGAPKANSHVCANVIARDVLLTVALMCQLVPGEDLHFNERMTRIFIEGLRHSYVSSES